MVGSLRIKAKRQKKPNQEGDQRRIADQEVLSLDTDSSSLSFGPLPQRNEDSQPKTDKIQLEDQEQQREKGEDGSTSSDQSPSSVSVSEQELKDFFNSLPDSEFQDIFDPDTPTEISVSSLDFDLEPIPLTILSDDENQIPFMPSSLPSFYVPVAEPYKKPVPILRVLPKIPWISESSSEAPFASRPKNVLRLNFSVFEDLVSKKFPTTSSSSSSSSFSSSSVPPESDQISSGSEADVKNKSGSKPLSTKKGKKVSASLQSTKSKK